MKFPGGSYFGQKPSLPLKGRDGQGPQVARDVLGTENTQVQIIQSKKNAQIPNAQIPNAICTLDRMHRLKEDRDP